MTFPPKTAFCAMQPALIAPATNYVPPAKITDNPTQKMNFFATALLVNSTTSLKHSGAATASLLF
jgi:hypothetical protein